MLLAKLALVVAAISCFADGFFKDIKFDEALTLAASDKKIVLIDFFTTWCGPCKKLDVTTWKDAKVQEWIEGKCVALKIDAEKEVELAKRYKIAVYPTILLLKADGTEIDRIVGYKDAATFLSEASDGLAGKDGVARAKAKLVGHEKDPLERQHYGDALARKGRHEEALSEYLWCFDNGRESASYSGVRLSFLLGSIVQLGRNHPPALDALRDRRDAAETRWAQGSDSFDDITDATALNRALKEPDRTLALYERLKGQKPLSAQMRKQFGRELLELLVAARRYQDVLELFDEPERHVREQLERSNSFPRSGRGPNEAEKELMEAVQKHARARAVVECSRVYEAVVGAGRVDVAGKIADDILAFASSGETYATLIACALRAGAPDIARAVGQCGLEVLPDAEKPAVRAALERVQAPK